MKVKPKMLNLGL